MKIFLVFATIAFMPAGRYALAASTVPVSYDVPSDLSVRPAWSAPAIGPAGTSVIAPGYGSRIIRVTDRWTQANAANSSFHSPTDPFMVNWNADSTMFWVRGAGGAIPYRFDPDSRSAYRVPRPGDASGGLLLDFAGPFSHRRPSIIYGARNLNIFEYDFNTGRRTIVFRGGDAVPGAAPGESMPAADDDDSRLCLAFSGKRGSFQYVAVLDRADGEYSVLDTKNSRLNGQPTAVPLGFGIDSAYLDRTGRYVIITKGNAGVGVSPTVVWDVASSVVAEVHNYLAGAQAAGFGVRVNESGYVATTAQSVNYAIRSLDPGLVSQPTFLLDPNLASSQEAPTATGHFSWNNAQPGTLMPIVGTHHRTTQDAGRPRKVWDDEIIAVATDGSSKVWRFAQHFSVVDGSNSWDIPRGNVSKDGRWYLFTSNWGKRLGNDPKGAARQDVFMVELKPGATVPAAEHDPPTLPPDPEPNPTPVPTTSEGGGMLTYTSPYCGPSGGSTSWACGAWPTTTPPSLGPAGTVVRDPDTQNRVLRVTGPGSFGEASTTVFKAFDGGWRRLWNADDSRFLVVSWNGGRAKNAMNWVAFDGSAMAVKGGTPVPYQFSDVEWDQDNPDLLVGIAGGAAQTYNVVTQAWTMVFNPTSTNWGGKSWLSGWGGSSVCIAAGPQDTGQRLACYDRSSRTPRVIDLRSQTINGAKFPVYYQGRQVKLPAGVTVHAMNMAPDGKFVALDTHGNSLCSVPGLANYASTTLFIDLTNNTGYEWSVACGGTHWAYGYNSMMVQSVSPKWTSTSINGPCNSDSRGIGRRNTDSTIDSSYVSVAPCGLFVNNTWNISVHLSWTNNRKDTKLNQYPVILGTVNEGVPNSFLWSDIAAMETSTAPYSARLWRFAQTWNSRSTNQCGFLSYSSPAVSRNGKWALFPSDWRGLTGKGVCTNGRRTDLFVFELK